MVIVVICGVILATLIIMIQVFLKQFIFSKNAKWKRRVKKTKALTLEKVNSQKLGKFKGLCESSHDVFSPLGQESCIYWQIMLCENGDMSHPLKKFHSPGKLRLQEGTAHASIDSSDVFPMVNTTNSKLEFYNPSQHEAVTQLCENTEFNIENIHSALKNDQLSITQQIIRRGEMVTVWAKLVVEDHDEYQLLPVDGESPVIIIV